MNLSIENKNHIDAILDDKTLGWLYPVLETGQAVCKAFVSSNNNFFDCKDFLNTVPGHLLSYSIYKELSHQCELPTNPFLLGKEMINSRNQYTIPVLKKGDVTISFMRSIMRKKIDNTEIKYLRDKCKKNNELDGQLSMENLIPCDEKNYHGVLIYGSKQDWDGIEFADIIFFDSNLEKINHEINLKNKLHIYESSGAAKSKDKNLLDANSIIKDFIKQVEE